MKLDNKLYDILAYISRYALPALGGLYYSLADIWSLPYGSQVLATCTAVTVALNILLGISSIEYNKQLKKAE
jgi:hypothetical protein